MCFKRAQVNTNRVRDKTGWGQGFAKAVDLVQYSAALQEAVGSGYPSVHCHTAGGSGQWLSFSTLPHCGGQCVFFRG